MAFYYLRRPKELELKLKNFGHHAEFNESGVNIKDLEKMINENRAVYDYSADMRTDKWSGSKKLVKTDLSEMPKYIVENKQKFKDWLV